MPIHLFVQADAFDPETVAVMGEAFEAALKEFDETGQTTAVREAVARRIIYAAKLGERDRDRLREAGLAVDGR